MVVLVPEPAGHSNEKLECIQCKQGIASSFSLEGTSGDHLIIYIVA